MRDNQSNRTHNIRFKKWLKSEKYKGLIPKKFELFSILTGGRIRLSGKSKASSRSGDDR